MTPAQEQSAVQKVISSLGLLAPQATLTQAVLKSANWALQALDADTTVTGGAQTGACWYQGPNGQQCCDLTSVQCALIPGATWDSEHNCPVGPANAPTIMTDTQVNQGGQKVITALGQLQINVGAPNDTALPSFV